MSIYGKDLFGNDIAPPSRGKLADFFTVPPFSVLNAREGFWQERKAAWIGLGIKSELGRGDNALGLSAECEDYRTASGDYTKCGAVEPVNGVGLAAGEQARREAEKCARKAARGDGAGYAPPASGLARCFGQDLMRGENPNFGQREKDAYGQTIDPDITRSGVVPTGTGPAITKDGNVNPYLARSRKPPSDGPRLTWVAGHRTVEELDETSQKILAAQSSSGTSIFDPVLCELAYKWFCPKGGSVLDPFAGGSVRGIVAGYLGHPYTGIDLRPEQVAANEAQRDAIPCKAQPRWVVGDSLNVDALVPDERFDLVFSCPPYGDLEVYSDDPADLSTMTHARFLEVYRVIVARAVARLRPNRFAAFVVGDFRDKRGFYRNFVTDTIRAFEDAGARLYNEAILVTAVGSLSIRVGKQFQAGRKLGKTHQQFLVFFKGDPKRIKADFGKIDGGFATAGDTEPEDASDETDDASEEPEPTDVPSVDAEPVAPIAETEQATLPVAPPADIPAAVLAPEGIGRKKTCIDCDGPIPPERKYRCDACVAAEQAKREARP